VAKTMTKSSTVAYLAEKTSLTRKQIEGILDETLMLASKEAKKSGVFPCRASEAGAREPQGADGSNPLTAIKIPAKRVCKFRLAKSLKDAVLGKK